jgi:hypothetical protein
VDTSSRSESGTPVLNNVLSPGLENGSSSDKKRKKARTTFTGKQIYELERQFEIKKYLSSSERSEMARLLNVTETQVRFLSTKIVPVPYSPDFALLKNNQEMKLSQ